MSIFRELALGRADRLERPETEVQDQSRSVKQLKSGIRQA